MWFKLGSMSPTQTIELRASIAQLGERETEDLKAPCLIHGRSIAKLACIRDSIVASIPACHAGDRGSIPRRGDCPSEHASLSFS